MDKWDTMPLSAQSCCILLSGVCLQASLRADLKTINQDRSKPSVEIANRIVDHRLMIRELPWENLQWRRYYGKGGPCIIFNISKDDQHYMRAENSVWWL